MARIAVIGTGTWGTAMAVQAHALPTNTVVLWGRDPSKVERLRTERRHPQIAEHQLPSDLCISHELADLAEVELVLWAVPTQFSTAIATSLAAALPAGVPVVSLAKGLEQDSYHRVTELLGKVLGQRPYGCLSGPSHAEEILGGLPAALVMAGPEALRHEVVDQIHGRNLRLYTSEDLVGVELGGALKNVVAVAAGICDGLCLGDNAKAALVTRGVAEMRRLGRALGANDATFAGLAGTGDLLATCYSPYGRNRALGLAVARGATADSHMAETGMVAEGAWTCRAAVALGRHHGVELPIASQVASVLWSGKDVTQAIEELLSRSAKDEDA
ncbi:MAG: NAD(P)-dependent glycerol-3-phosphate dehydrogenase [Planctomycetota bacterium]|nr:NAD(P)-dependent glycerol-3-phosphate dehydrogenase [Planctomycetota bacterium]